MSLPAGLQRSFRHRRERPAFVTKQPTLRRRVAAARLPFVACVFAGCDASRSHIVRYDYAVNASVMGSYGQTNDLMATFEAPTAARPWIRSTFQWSKHTALADERYNGTLMWTDDPASFRDCGFAFK